ncbi:hypothetical protein FGG08_004846 [Glutinoglossum americanum]|uniref:Uncharacterized protein n=1 Tax=Glutinoglossum americanum TaxID=1670608 RepID=A0A9P8KZ42_9PEZI|nr:hypothetical protein FGG08_004846 [Glutinoglossum americanum]
MAYKEDRTSHGILKVIGLYTARCVSIRFKKWDRGNGKSPSGVPIDFELVSVRDGGFGLKMPKDADPLSGPGMPGVPIQAVNENKIDGWLAAAIVDLRKAKSVHSECHER